MRIRSVTVRSALSCCQLAFLPDLGIVAHCRAAFSSVMNYALGEWLKNELAQALWTGIIFNLALLSVFKYLPLLAVRAVRFAALIFKRILFPAGVSY